MVGHILPAFHRLYPGVRLLVTTTNRRIDLVEERIDIAIRARDQLDTDNNLIVRKLGEARQFLAASPALMARIGNVTIDTLDKVPTLSMNEQHLSDIWRLVEAKEHTEITHQPIIGCGDFGILERAAIEGVGIALLPDHLCGRGFRTGVLAPVLPDWSSNATIAHLVFTSRHGLLPSVRALIDFLAENLLNALQKCREITPRGAGTFDI